MRATYEANRAPEDAALLEEIYSSDSFKNGDPDAVDVVDVSDLDHPTVVGSLGLPGGPSHQLLVSGDAQPSPQA